LLGVVVMVTRPAHQTDALARRIEAAGGRAICFPVLEIVYLDDAIAFARLADRLGEFAFWIFVSVNAVTGWMRLLQPHHLTQVRSRLVAVGAGTANALERAGFPAPLRPRRRSGTESLLELPELSSEAVAKRRVLIIRGVGGRERLGSTLAARGASVEYAEVYRRARPVVAAEKLLIHRGKVNATVVTSVEALVNLFEIGGPRARSWLTTMPLVTVSERIAQFASSIGVQNPPIVADDASDEAIVAALCRWHQSEHRSTQNKPHDHNR
jgi:uroporphyrinogen-III synthase